MRPAVAADVDGIAAMILARSTWLEENNLPSWREYADGLAAQAAAPNSPAWILADQDRIVGCTTVLETAPPWGWTPEELDEPALYLYTTATDPAYRSRKPGALIALWAVDRAAQEGKQWVRRGCAFPGLVSYYQQQGFALLHEVQRTRNLIRLMQRPAARVPALAECCRTLQADGTG